MDMEQPIHPPYTFVIDPCDVCLDASGGSAEANEEEVAELTKISDSLKDRTWPCKKPVRLLYKGGVIKEGRLHTHYQNLPDRVAGVRINTLIGGQQIAEIYVNANQLRSQLAELHKIDAGDKPYEDVGKAAAKNNRNTAKEFFIGAMSVDGRQIEMESGSTEGRMKVMFEAPEPACAKLYPDL
jgi:hypothetical protein